MTTLADKASVNVTILAGFGLFIAPGSESQINRFPGQPHVYGPSGGFYGPVRADTPVVLVSTRGIVNYFQQQKGGNVMVSTTTPIDADGMPNGTIVIVP